MTKLTPLERASHELLCAALRVKDLYGQGKPVTEDAYDLCSRAFDVMMSLPTNMVMGPIIERDEQTTVMQ